MGQQPLDLLMIQLGLKNTDLVYATTESLTHKMVQRGRKGRRLTRRIQERICAALALATGKTFTTSQLFTYRGHV